MIEVIKTKKKKKKQDPYYILKYEYMIGDADGNTSEKVEVLADNPYLERYVKLLNLLRPLEGTWGIVLDSYEFHKFVEQGQITEDDYKFLNHLMWEGTDLYEGIEEDDEHAWPFCEGVQGETEYSFLVFEGIKLTYVDEDGVKHKTKIT